MYHIRIFTHLSHFNELPMPHLAKLIHSAQSRDERGDLPFRARRLIVLNL